MTGSRAVGLGISAESRLSKSLRSGKFVGAPIRHRIHLTRSQDAPKEATGIRPGVSRRIPLTAEMGDA
jgi:hypothetical protein